MEYYTILTDVGRVLEAAALAGERSYTLAFCALGDGSGIPEPEQTALRGEVWCGPIDTLIADHENPNWLIVETHVPPEAGGFTIREFGIYTDDGVLFAVGNYPETYKPTFSEGTGIDLLVRVICKVENAELVTLLTDPSVALASKKYVDELLKKIPRRNVGEVFYYQGNNAPYGSVIADGSLLSRDIYPDLWTFAQESGRVISDAQWQTKAGTESSVGFFSDGDGSTTFRVPKLSDYIRATDTPTLVGQWQGDAIRNITGHTNGGNSYVYREASTDGVFYTSDDAPKCIPTITTDGENNAVLFFDASRVVPTAEENRPKTIRLLACIHAFDAIIPKAQADMHEILTALAGKEDRIKRLSSATTLYVRHEGSDENDGLTPETAVRTFERAYYILRTWDCMGYDVTVDIGPGAWPGFSVPRGININRLFVQGAGSSLTTLSEPGGYGVTQYISSCIPTIRRMTIRECSHCIVANFQSTADIRDDVNFGTATAVHILAWNNSAITHSANEWRISGGARTHASARFGSAIHINNCKINLENTLHFSDGFVSADHGGTINAHTLTFEGTATGRQYHVNANGVIYTASEEEDYFPGDQKGATNNGGIYF